MKNSSLASGASTDALKLAAAFIDPNAIGAVCLTEDRVSKLRATRLTHWVI